MVAKAAKPRVVATRFYRDDKGEKIVARIHKPVRGELHAWECAFTISGLPDPVASRGFGVDSMQALMIAIDGVRYHLERAAPTATFLRGEPGDFGIRRTIPFYGMEIYRRLIALVEEESTRLVREMVAARRNNRKTPSPRD